MKMVKKKATAKTPDKKEQVGFHKGALATLLKERQELIKMLQVVETLLQAHVNELKKLGVDVTKPKSK